MTWRWERKTYSRTCLCYRFCNKHLPSSHYPIFFCLVSHSTSNHIQRLMLQSVAYRFCNVVLSLILYVTLNLGNRTSIISTFFIPPTGFIILAVEKRLKLFGVLQNWPQIHAPTRFRKNIMRLSITKGLVHALKVQMNYN